MTIKSERVYWLVCDLCDFNSTEDNDYEAWLDVDSAIADAEDANWRTVKDCHYCPECRDRVCTECGTVAAEPLGASDYQCPTRCANPA